MSRNDLTKINKHIHIYIGAKQFRHKLEWGAKTSYDEQKKLIEEYTKAYQTKSIDQLLLVKLQHFLDQINQLHSKIHIEVDMNLFKEHPVDHAIDIIHAVDREIDGLYRHMLDDVIDDYDGLCDQSQKTINKIKSLITERNLVGNFIYNTSEDDIFGCDD